MRFHSTVFATFLTLFVLTPLGKTTNQLSGQTEQSKQKCPSPYSFDNPYNPFRDDIFINELQQLRFNLSLLSLAEKDKDIGGKIRPFTQIIVNTSVFALSNFTNWRAVYLQSCITEEVMHSDEMEWANEQFLKLFQRIFDSGEFRPFLERWAKNSGAFLCSHGSLCISNRDILIIKGRVVKLLKKQGKYVSKENAQRNFMIVISRLLLSEGKDIGNLSNQAFKPTPQLALSEYGTTLANMELKTLNKWWEKLPLVEKLAALSAYYQPQD